MSSASENMNSITIMIMITVTISSKNSTHNADDKQSRDEELGRI